MCYGKLINDGVVCWGLTCSKVDLYEADTKNDRNLTVLIKCSNM